MNKKEDHSEDCEYFELDEPVRMINDKLYVIKEGIEIGTNSVIQYNSSNNQISVISLDYLVGRKTSKAYFVNEVTNELHKIDFEDLIEYIRKCIIENNK